MRRLVVIAALAAIGGSAVVGVAASAPVRRTAAVDSAGAASSAPRITSDIVAARLATAKYATNLARAKADGYGIITRMIPNMGYHFLNPNVTGFNVRKPAILVYEHHGNAWQLGALEWVFTAMPAKPPLPGARYGVFGRRATTSTGRSCSRPQNRAVPPRVRRRAPHSTSGIPG
jgi:hypothetical protein